MRLHVRPCTTALMMAARAEVQHTPTAASTAREAAGLRSADLLKALAGLAVLDWEGIGDASRSRSRCFDVVEMSGAARIPGSASITYGGRGG